MELTIIKKKEDYDIINEAIKQAKMDVSIIEFEISQKRKELRKAVAKLHTLQVKAKNLRQP